MAWVVQDLLVVTFLIVIFAAGLVLLIFLALTRIYSHEATRSQFGSALVSLLIAVLFSVTLSNLYAVRRDRDNRFRAFRDQHFAQLRPILRTESSKLEQIASQVIKQGHISKIASYVGAPTNMEDVLWPDVMSGDLSNHFADYDKAKRSLLSEARAQDDEFRTALSIAEHQIKPIANLDSYSREVAAMSFVEFCTGRGVGVKLRIAEGGYSFEYWGGSVGGSGPSTNPPRPSPDQVATFRAFQSLRPDSSLSAHCDSLKRRAETVKRAAQELSKEAQLLSESAILKGNCDFLKSDSLSD